MLRPERRIKVTGRIQWFIGPRRPKLHKFLIWSLFWMPRIPFRSLFHQKLGPYIQAYRFGDSSLVHCSATHPMSDFDFWLWSSQVFGMIPTEFIGSVERQGICSACENRILVWVLKHCSHVGPHLGTFVPMGTKMIFLVPIFFESPYFLHLGLRMRQKPVQPL